MSAYLPSQRSAAMQDAFQHLKSDWQPNPKLKKFFPHSEGALTPGMRTGPNVWCNIEMWATDKFYSRDEWLAWDKDFANRFDKKPEVTDTPYDGDHMTCARFLRFFADKFHANPEISYLEKGHYLLKQTIGRAKTFALENWDGKAATYETFMSNFIKHFWDPEKITKTLRERILFHPDIEKHDFAAIKHLEKLMAEYCTHVDNWHPSEWYSFMDIFDALKSKMIKHNKVITHYEIIKKELDYSNGQIPAGQECLRACAEYLTLMVDNQNELEKASSRYGTQPNTKKSQAEIAALKSDERKQRGEKPQHAASNNVVLHASAAPATTSLLDLDYYDPNSSAPPLEPVVLPQSASHAVPLPSADSDSDYDSDPDLDTLHLYATQVPIKKVPTCELCNTAGHWPAKCWSFKTRCTTKKKQAAANKLCFRCMKKYDANHQCSPGVTGCSYCKQTNHHRAICFEAERDYLKSKVRERSDSRQRNNREKTPQPRGRASTPGPGPTIDRIERLRRTDTPTRKKELTSRSRLQQRFNQRQRKTPYQKQKRTVAKLASFTYRPRSPSPAAKNITYKGRTPGTSKGYRPTSRSPSTSDLRGRSPHPSKGKPSVAATTYDQDDSSLYHTSTLPPMAQTETRRSTSSSSDSMVKPTHCEDFQIALTRGDLAVRNRSASTVLPFATLSLMTPEKEPVQLLCLLDTGANKSYLMAQRAPKIYSKALCDPYPVSVNTYNGPQVYTGKWIRVHFTFTSPNGSRQVLPMEIFSTNHPGMDAPALDAHPWVASDPTINGIYPRPAQTLLLIIGAADVPRLLTDDIHIGPRCMVMHTYWGSVYAGSNEPITAEEEIRPASDDCDKNTLVKAPLPREKSLLYHTSAPLDDVLPVNFLFHTESNPKDRCGLIKRWLNLMEENTHFPGDELPNTLTAGQVQAKNIIDEQMKFQPDKGRFITTILKDPSIKVPNNYNIALQIWRSQHRKMQLDKTGETKRLYQKKFDEFKNSNSIHRVDTKTPWKGDAFYSSFKMVFKDSLTSPERLTVNSSLGKQSLNHAVLPTPNLLPSIFKMQLLARMGEHYTIADVSRMFLSVDTIKKDQIYNRFLWSDLDDPDAPIEVWEFNTIPWGLATSPYIAIRALFKAFELEGALPDAPDWTRYVCATAPAFFYMDDFGKGFASEKEAIAYCKELHRILGKYGFLIRKFSSSSQNIISALPEEWRAPFTTDAIRRISTSDDTTQLGYSWSPSTDTLTFDRFKGIATRFKATVRSLLSLLSGVFDPLGLAGGKILEARQVMQACFRHDPPLAWDDPISKLGPKMEKKCLEWVKDLDNLHTFSVPRYVPNNPESFWVFFSDASIDGIGVNLYCVTQTPQGPVSNLVLTKCKASPASEARLQVSVPKLECRGCSVAFHVALDVQDILKIPDDRVVFYTDSLASVFWARQDPKKLVTFVSNRLGPFQKKGWTLHWCSGEENPSDQSSRGCKVRDLSSELQLHGPKFLTALPPEDWPKQLPDFSTLDKTECFTKKYLKQTTAGTDIVASTLDLPQEVYHIFLNPDDPNADLHTRELRRSPIGSDTFCQSYGTAPALFRAVATLYMALDKWISVCRNRQEHYTSADHWKDGAPKTTHLFLRQTSRPHPRGFQPGFTPLEVVYRDKSKALIFRQAQLTNYYQEYQALLHGHQLPPKSRLQSLRPFLDPYQCMRLQGRMSRAQNLSYNEKHPVLLPANASVTRIIAYDAHRLSGHKQVSTTHNIVNKEYHVPGFDSYFRKFYAECVLCDLRSSKFGIAPLGQVYDARLGKHRSFYFCNTDMIGPYYLTNPKASPTDPQTYSKVFAYIFTCITTRFATCFVVKDAGTREFLDAFVRLTSHHGAPSVITSDNQSCFIPAARILEDVTDKCELDHPADCAGHLELLKKLEPIKWHFNVAGASHRNSTEIFVKSVKLGLHKVLPMIHTAHVDHAAHGITYLPVDLLGFQTLLDKLFTTINDRPLQPVHGVDNLYVTPSRLALGRALWPAERSVHDASEYPEPDLAVTAREQRLVQDEFFDEFQGHLRDKLRVFHNWNKSANHHLRIGDWVMVPPSHGVKRHRYIPAQITDIHKSEDNEVRTISVLVPGKKTPAGRPAKNKTAQFSIQQVCPLETDYNKRRLTFARQPQVLTFDSTLPVSQLTPYCPSEDSFVDKAPFEIVDTPDEVPPPEDRTIPTFTRSGRQSRAPKKLDL